MSVLGVQTDSAVSPFGSGRLETSSAPRVSKPKSAVVLAGRATVPHSDRTRPSDHS